MGEPLKLRATDAEDLEVFSTVLQDALVNMNDMAFLEGENRFVLVATRFRWEDVAKASGQGTPFERVLCGLSFEDVSRVRMRGIDRARDADRILELLAVRKEADGVHLVLAGGAEISLESEKVLCHLKDLGEPWPVFARPSHPLEDES